MCICTSYTAPCLPSTCINNGTCVAMNDTTGYYCVCIGSFFGKFCEYTQKVSYVTSTERIGIPTHIKEVNTVYELENFRGWNRKGPFMGKCSR